MFATMKPLLLTLLLFAAPAFAAPPATETRLTLKVTSVHDGDTFTGINQNNEQVKVRLDAVDAPELSQPYGQASKKALGDKIFGKTVTVITKKHDRYGRTIGHVVIDKRDVNLELLEVGAVWHTCSANTKRWANRKDNDPSSTSCRTKANRGEGG